MCNKVVRETGDTSFEIFKDNLKPHTKIIWDWEWLPQSFDKNGFVTVARDKTMKYWIFNAEKKYYELISSIRFKEPVTAVSVYNKTVNEANYLLVSVGLNDGDLKLIKINKEGKECKEIEDISFDLGKPCDRINKLKFNQLATGEKNSILLACSSVDTSLRIYKIKI